MSIDSKAKTIGQIYNAMEYTLDDTDESDAILAIGKWVPLEEAQKLELQLKQSNQVADDALQENRELGTKIAEANKILGFPEKGSLILTKKQQKDYSYVLNYDDIKHLREVLQ
jgi:hypothetical protein